MIGHHLTFSELTATTTAPPAVNGEVSNMLGTRSRAHLHSDLVATFSSRDIRRIGRNCHGVTSY